MGHDGVVLGLDQNKEAAAAGLIAVWPQDLAAVARRDNGGLFIPGAKLSGLESRTGSTPQATLHVPWMRQPF
jgi:hypothetical protein